MTGGVVGPPVVGVVGGVMTGGVTGGGAGGCVMGVVGVWGAGANIPAV